MGQCTSKQHVHYPPGLVALQHDDVGSSATSNSTAHNLAKYLAENPLNVSSKSHSTRRSVLRDSAAAPVGADMSCSSTMNLSSLEMSSTLENSNSNFERSARSFVVDRSGRSHSHRTASYDNPMERSARSSGASRRGGMDLDLSSSNGGGQLDPLPEELSMHMQLSEDTQTQTSGGCYSTSQGATTVSTPPAVPLAPGEKRFSPPSKHPKKKRSSSGNNSKGSSSRDGGSGERRRRSRNSSSTKKAPHPGMDVSTNSQISAASSSSCQQQQQQQQAKKRIRKARSETATTLPQQPQLRTKEDSVRQSLQVCDLGRSKLGKGKDSSWQGLSLTSSGSQMYESYETSSSSWGLSQLRLQLQEASPTSCHNVMDLSRMEKDAMNNMHGFAFTDESEHEDEDDDEDDEDEVQSQSNEKGDENPHDRISEAEAKEKEPCNIHVTVRIEQ